MEARPKIIAAEIPQHEEGLARVAPPVTALWLLVIAALSVLPSPVDEVKHLERARAILKRVEAHREACSKRPPVVITMTAPTNEAAPFIPLVPLPPAQNPIDEHVDDAFRKIADVASALDIKPMPTIEKPPPVPPHPRDDEGFICRYPDREQVQSWFRRRVLPILKKCVTGEHAKGALEISFDSIGRVKDTTLVGFSDELTTCATPRLRALAHPDAADLSFVFPIVVDGG